MNAIDATVFGLHGRFVAYPPPGESALSAWPWVAHGAMRIWNSYTLWYDVNPAPGVFDFGRLDKIIDQATTRGVKVIITLGRTPTWASARPDEVAGMVPGSAAEPANLCDWDAYVHAVVTRYAGRVEGYEMWNEPAFADFENVYRDDGSAKQFFTGKSTDMVLLTQRARAIVKAIDPDAKIISPSVTCEANGIGRLGAYLNAGGGELCDVIGYHFYQPYPEDAMAEAIALNGLLLARGLSLPIWNTEQGYILDDSDITPIDDIPPRKSWTTTLSPRNAGIYLARAYLVQWCAGVERIYWYTWDHDIAPDPMGLSSSGAALNDQGLAFGKVQSWQVGAILTRWVRSPEGLWTLNFLRGTQAFTVHWSERGTHEVPTTARTTAESLYWQPVLMAGATMLVGQEPILVVDYT